MIDTGKQSDNGNAGAAAEEVVAPVSDAARGEEATRLAKPAGETPKATGSAEKVPPAPPGARGGSWRIYLLTVSCFLLGCSQFAILGIIAQVADSAGVTVAAAGQLVTVFATANALLTPFALMLTARLGARRQLMIGLVLMLVGMVATAALWSYLPQMLARVVMGVGNGLFVATSFATAARLAREGHEAQALSNVSLGFSSAFVLAIPLGRLIAAAVDWHAIYAGLAVFALVILFVIAKVMPQTRGAAGTSFKQQVAPLGDARIRLALSVTFLTFLGYALFNTYLTPYLETVIVDDAGLVSIVLLVLGLMSVIGTKAGGFLGDRIGYKLTLLAGLALQILALASLPAAAGWLPVFIVALCVWMAARWSFIPVQNLNLISLTKGNPAMVIGLSNSFLQLGNAAGAGFGGIVVHALSVPSLTWVSTAFEVVAFVLMAVLFRRGIRRRLEKARGGAPQR